MTKISGSYSREDEIENRKEAYSYNDYVVELTGKSPKSGGEATLHMSIVGGYSVDTTPDVECVEGVFNFKTIKPIKSSGKGYCESGEIEVNNAKMEFSSGKVKVLVDNQQKEYSCEELRGLCKYEPITIAEGVEKKPCPVWFKDKDKDGYTDGTTKVACEKPSDEYVSSATAGDCDDGDSSINPGRAEICDNKDNNCNGLIDEGFNVGQSCSVGVGECARTGQYICKADGTGTECNATPGTPTPEVCDGLDNNCNGIIDDGVLLVFYKDMDGDGYTDGTTQVGCTAPSGYVLSATSGDCNDNDPNINPGKAEICDGIDNNCNGQTDEDNVCGVAEAKVAVGGYHTCAIKQGGSLWCWGRNNAGQVGDGTNSDKNTPVQIMSSGVVSVALGGYHTCAIKQDGSLWCWGRNDYGQLGDGTNTDKNTPVQIMASGVSSVAAGRHHTCAIKQDGSLWCWGYNGSGQIGDGTYTNKYSPVQIISSGMVSVALGGGHTCAIKQDGSLWCWGDNWAGQLGDGTNTNKNTPVQIMSSGVSSVAAGDEHTCAVKTDGSLWCWGYNNYGQLGDGTWVSKNTPVQIMASGVVAVALGYYHTCAIKQDGSLWCWGRNNYGQLGDGTNTDKNTPVQIMSSGVVAVALGVYRTCAIKQDGSLWCWGYSGSGQIMSSGVVSVALGSGHTCAIKQDGSLWCWGDNNYGQLGDGTNTDKNTPVQIMASGVSSVAAGRHHTCAIKQDGSLWCWGFNYHGQLGDGRWTWMSKPVYIMNLGSGGGAPSIFFGEKSSFDNREQKHSNIAQEQTRYGCSSANIVFYVLHLIFPAFILFALRKRKTC